MDKLSIAGIFIAIIAIYLGFTLDGGSVLALVEFPAFIIVFGGTLGAVLLQSSSVQFFHSLSLLKWVIYPPQYNISDGIDAVLLWAEKSRESGYLSLEVYALDVEDEFVQKGLNFLVDGVEIERIKESLELEIDLQREHSLRSANIFDAMGGYSPTIGILGAVLGLIHAMSNLSNPDMLGAGIATAFVATIYGVGFANLIYLPIANKIKGIVHHETTYREMIAEGIIAIANSENPHVIENKLSSFRVK